MDRSKRTPFLLLSILTAILFLGLRHGLQVFDPTDLSWLRGDAQFHHIAFAFFKQDSWHWPPGAFYNLSYPIGTSIGATDSIPLMALLFKAFRSFIPLKFHYFGWWQVICMGLQGYWGFQILNERLQSPLKSYLGSLFISLTPVLLSWRFIHGGLSAHFLLLWSLSFYFPLKENPENKLPLKSFLLIHFLASLIQPYFLPMIFGFFFLYAALRKNQETYFQLGLKLFYLLGISLVGLYLAGHFETGSNQDSWGFGYYNTDLSSLINPMNSSLIIPSLPLRDGQHEGFSYLGLGGILLLTSLFFQYSNESIKRVLKDHKFLFLLLLAFFIYSFGSTYSLFGWRFLSISKVYWLIGPLKNIFRSTGRFIWPVYYSLFFIGVYLSLKNFSIRKTRALFILALIIQIVDLSPLFYREEKLLPFAMIARFQKPFKTNSIPMDIKGISKISLFPRKYGEKDCEKGAPLNEQQERDFYWMALKNSLKSTALMGAGRSSKMLINKQCQKEWDILNTLGPEKHILYVFSDTLPNSKKFKDTTHCIDFNGLSWCSRR